MILCCRTGTCFETGQYWSIVTFQLPCPHVATVTCGCVWPGLWRKTLHRIWLLAPVLWWQTPRPGWNPKANTTHRIYDHFLSTHYQRESNNILYSITILCHVVSLEHGNLFIEIFKHFVDGSVTFFWMAKNENGQCLFDLTFLHLKFKTLNNFIVRSVKKNAY